MPTTYEVVLNKNDGDGFGFVIISSANNNGSTIGLVDYFFMPEQYWSFNEHFQIIRHCFRKNNLVGLSSTEVIMWWRRISFSFSFAETDVRKVEIMSASRDILDNLLLYGFYLELPFSGSNVVMPDMRDKDTFFVDINF